MKFREAKKATQGHKAIKWQCPRFNIGLPDYKARSLTTRPKMTLTVSLYGIYKLLYKK